MTGFPWIRVESVRTLIQTTIQVAWDEDEGSRGAYVVQDVNGS